jgi:hypothetical protein
MTRDVHNNASSQNQYEQLAEELLRWYFQQTVIRQLPPLQTPTNDSIATLDSQQRVTIGVDRSSLVADSSPGGLHSYTIPFQLHIRPSDSLTAPVSEPALSSTSASRYGRYALLALLCLLALALLFVPWEPPRIFRFPSNHDGMRALDKPTPGAGSYRPSPARPLPGSELSAPHRSPDPNLPL